MIDTVNIYSYRFLTEHFSILKYPNSGWWQRSAYMEKYLNSILVYNKTIVEQPIKLESLANKLTDKSVEFLENYNANVISTENQIRHPQAQKPFALFHSFSNVHTPLVTGSEFKGKAPGIHGAYGDSVMEMDHQVIIGVIWCLCTF